MLILLCIAFLVSCAKKDSTDRTAQGELVKIETGGNVPFGFIFILVTGKNIDRIRPACYNDTILKRKGERLYYGRTK